MLQKANKEESSPEKSLHVPNPISGEAKLPRLNVFTSEAHIYAQIIDEEKNATLVAASSMDKDLYLTPHIYDNAKVVGAAIAKKALEKGITRVVFDRVKHTYLNRVDFLAMAAREGGLKFQDYEG